MDQTLTARGRVHHAVNPNTFRSAVRPVRSAKLRVAAVSDALKAQCQPQSHVEQKETYLGEKFWQIQPLKQGQQADYRDSASVDKAPEVHLTSLNHVSLEAADPTALSDFYTRVLGFSSIDRPDFPFDGAWLEGAGLLLHIIQQDPSVPRRFQSWKDKYTEEPRPWFIRRANHLAFEVEDAAAMEARLVFFGVEYTKVYVPDTDAAQLFFFDSEGHGVEVGCDYAKVAGMLKRKLGNNGAAVAP
ncbi:hypothetical protein WJX77_007932 [Trebouxia sp. C0004]